MKTAAREMSRVHREVNALLKEVQEYVDDLREDFEDTERAGWDYVGSMKRVRQGLEDLLPEED